MPTAGCPYGPLTEALRGYLRDLPPERVGEILGPARDEIGRLLPGIGQTRSRGSANRAGANGAGAPDATPTSRTDIRSGLGQARLFGLLLGLLGDLASDIARSSWSSRTSTGSIARPATS